jgi:hypothetical protein
VKPVKLNQHMEPKQWVGIDVSGKRLEVYVRPSQRMLKVANSPTGLATGGVPNCTGFAECFSRLSVADEVQIEASFCEAISTAKEQKSIALATRAAASLGPSLTVPAEDRRQ